MATERFEVELGANITPYKNKMKEASNIAKQTSQKIKESTKVEFTSKVIDKQIEDVKKKLAELEKVTFKFNESVSGGLISRETIGTEEQVKQYDKLIDKLNTLYDKKGQLENKTLEENSNIREQNAEYQRQKELLEGISKVKAMMPNLRKLSPSISFSEGNGFSGMSADFSPQVKNTTKHTNLLSVAFSKVKNKIKEAKAEMSGMNFASKQLKSGVNGIGNTISSAFSKGLKSVKRLTLGFLGARSAFSLFRKYMSEYQNQNEEFANKMQSITAIITNSLAPAFEFFGNLLQKVAVIFAKLMKMIFKIDVLGKTVNNNLKGTAKNTKSIGDNLTNLDEITNLQSDSGSDGADSGIGNFEFPDVDTSKIEAAFEKIKRLGAKLFEPVKKAWDKVGKNVIQSAKNMGSNLLGLFGAVGKSLIEVWTNGTGEKLVENSLKQWSVLFDIVGGVAEAIKNAWENASNGTGILQSVLDIAIQIQELFLSITESIKNWVISENFQNALNAVFDILNDLFKIASDIVSWIGEMYEKYLAPVVDKMLAAIGSIVEMIGAIWNVVEPVVSQVVGIIKTILEPAIQIISSAIGGIFDILNGLAQFITGIFTLNWEKAWSGIKTIFEGVWNGIKGIFKGVINLIISGINLLIKAINTITTPIRALIVGIGKVLGKNFTMDNIKIPTIPKLDVGTNYVPEDMLAVVHKGEAVVPKKFNEKEYFGNEETNALLMQLNSSVLELAKNPTQLYVNGKELAKATYSDYQEEGSRRGANTSIRRV